MREQGWVCLPLRDLRGYPPSYVPGLGGRGIGEKSPMVERVLIFARKDGRPLRPQRGRKSAARNRLWGLHHAPKKHKPAQVPQRSEGLVQMTICKPRRGQAGPSRDLHRSESEEGLDKVATLIRSDPSNAHDGWEVRGGAHRHGRCGASFSLDKPRRSLGGRGLTLLIGRFQEGLGRRMELRIACLDFIINFGLRLSKVL